MEESVRATSNALVVLPLCAMFVIVLMCVHKAIKETPFFGDAAGWVVAFCVTLLVGLVRFLGSAAQPAYSEAEPREAAQIPSSDASGKAITAKARRGSTTIEMAGDGRRQWAGARPDAPKDGDDVPQRGGRVLR